MNKQEIIRKSDFIITFGSMLADNKEEIRDCIIEAIAKQDTTFVYMHPIDNIDLKLFYNQFIKYEVGSEEGVCSLLLDTFVKSSNGTIQSYIEDLDLGYISAESSAGEEEFEEMLELSEQNENKTLIIGDDLIEHERIDNLVKMLSIIKRYSSLNVLVLNEELEKKIDECLDENLEEVEDLKSYNGTLVYRLEDKTQDDLLLCSKSFSMIAKVKDKDEVEISYKNAILKKTICIDDRLTGTIALIKTSSNDNELVQAYRYKQIKVKVVEA